MDASLTGRLILVAEDELLIALDIKQAFEDEGARVLMASTLNDALRGVEELELSAAILDHALSDGDSLRVCARMNKRNIPFVTYSGYDQSRRKGVHVEKPASMSVLVATVRSLLSPQKHFPVA